MTPHRNRPQRLNHRLGAKLRVGISRLYFFAVYFFELNFQLHSFPREDELQTCPFRNSKIVFMKAVNFLPETLIAL